MPQMSTTALAALLTGVGVVLLALFVGLGFLLIRAHRAHKRLLADLEERGVQIAQAHEQESKRASITRPRAVLRRNTTLPFNAKSGWGALPSVESINPIEPTTVPPHYAPPKPAGFVSGPSRLTWPFTARRSSGKGKAIHLKKIRVPVLSTVIESPKPSPLAPILTRSSLGDPPSPMKSGSRRSSDQSLLQYHPAFRNTWEEGRTERTDAPQSDINRRSLTAKPVAKPQPRVNRARSVAEIPLCNINGAVSQQPLANRHSRSSSFHSQSSGNVPDSPIPPLPLEVARIKTQDPRGSLLSHSPSSFSVSSFESGGSSILATQSSPIPRSRNFRVQAVTKRDWRNSMIVGARPLRNTIPSHSRNQRSQGSIKSTAARLSLGTPTTKEERQAENRSSTITNSSTQSIKLKTAESVTLSKVYSPTGSPLTVRNITPKRRSGCSVTAYGSPEERRKTPSVLADASGNKAILERQPSEVSTKASSTRSSNGNPFQWDPAPLASWKPSALKGSPSARKGHRRQNTVRISELAPTTLGPPTPSRSPSPSVMNDILEELPNASSGLAFSRNPSLPRLSSSSTFAPELKMTTTSIRASLTLSSPTLSMAPYDYGPVGAPKGYVNANNRMSMNSIYTIPAFPSPVHDMGSVEATASPPPAFALSRPSNNFAEFCEIDSPIGPSSPFESLLPVMSSPSGRPLPGDEYDPELPGLIQTPTASPARNLSSQFSTIHEESSATARRTNEYEQLPDEDSPPCSPKTMRPLSLPGTPQGSLIPQYSIQYSDIPEGSILHTIDPSVLSKDPFSVLNSGYSAGFNSSKPLYETQNGTPMPTSPRLAQTMLDPLLEAAFPSSPPVQQSVEARNYGNLLEPIPMLSIQSSASSMYSAPSPPSSPCSPLPRHALLPTPALNFSDMPMLSPSLNGPRGSPPRPLRTSIAKLRRMNSDAEQSGKAKAGRGERRYLRLGREASLALPGDDSFLDDLSNGEDDEESTVHVLNEEKGRRLVGGDLLDWEEDATILDLDYEEPTTQSSNTRDMQQNNQTPQLRPVAPSPRPDLVDRSSSIWDDGERFWQSTPPRPTTSPNKPKNNNHMPLSESPCTPKTLKTTNTSRKREFEVAKDDDSPTQSENKFRFNEEDADGNRNSRKSLAGNRSRKRSVLGVGTPNTNVRIQIQPPSGSVNGGTPGSLYDGDGFLRM